MYYNLVLNILVVLLFCGVVIWVDMSLKKKHSTFISGIMFGLITLFVMSSRIVIGEGHYFDFRTVILTLAGFTGGPVTALITAIMSALFRYSMGGSGLVSGITNIVVFACFGCVLRWYLCNRNGKRIWLWFIIGIIMACIDLFVIAFIPSLDSGSFLAFRLVAGPVIIITPLATTVIFTYYFWAREIFSNASILKAIIKSSAINLLVFDAHAPILLSENMKTELKAYPFIEKMFPMLYTDKSWKSVTEPQRKEIITEDGRNFVADLSSFQMPSGENACVAIINDVTDRRVQQEKLRVAEEKFSKAFQLAPYMMTILRKSDYRYVDANRRFLETRGFSREDVINKTPIEIGVPEDEFIRNIKTLENQRSIQNVESTLVSKDISLGMAILSAEEIQIDDQECFIFAYNDITEIKQLQTEKVKQLTSNLALKAELSQSNQLIADIMTHMQDAFYVLDNQWRFTFVNNKAEKLLKKTRAELIGKVLWDINPLTRDCLCGSNFQKAWDDCLPITFEVHCVLNKGLWNQVTAYPTQYGLSVYYRDITEQKLVQEKLTKSQEEKASILESMTDCFFVVDSDWQFSYINRAAEIALGKSSDELLGKKMTEVYKVNDTALRHYHKVMSEKKSVHFEGISGALDNKWFETSVYPTETGMSLYFRDITSRKLAEETLRQSEEKFSKVFHSGPIMMTLGNLEDGKFVDANEAFCLGTGYKHDEIIGHPARELRLIDFDKRNEVTKMLMEKGRIENEEIAFRTKLGEIRRGFCWSHLLHIDGERIAITGIIDITEQKRIQSEMARLDRLNLVGQLAAGIAHEIRNPMTTVRGYLQLLGDKPDFASRKSTFELMISEVDRANAIITEFLSLAQTKPTDLKSQNLNDIINNLYPLIEADTFTQNKQIIFMPGEIPNLELNAKEISQMILNFTRNGLEAMGEGGSLRIESYLEDCKVVLEITDEGCGIPQENINKLGTPFFTTKETGTGLGLASCYKIAESHSAKIRIDSSSGGTTFFVLFPILYQEQKENVKERLISLP